MIKKFIKDLPIYVNGYAVTYLFLQASFNWVNVVMWVLAAGSFLKYSLKK